MSEERIQWEPYRPLGNDPEKFTARGSPWTNGRTHFVAPMPVGPLPNLIVLNPPPLPKEPSRKRGLPKLPITDVHRRQLASVRRRLAQRMARHPELEPSVRREFAKMKSLTERTRSGDFDGLEEYLQAQQELRSGQTAAALRETGVGE